MRIPEVPLTIVDNIITLALAEDVGPGDVTTNAVVNPETRAKAQLLTRSQMVICGLHVAQRCFELVDETINFKALCKDGDEPAIDQVIVRIQGNAGMMLMAERVALNLLQHMSGVATLTRSYVSAVSATKARIAATRKTLPGLRSLEKYAVQVGGGIPHRHGLYDGVLIKDNHIALARGIDTAVERAKKYGHHLLAIEVEVTDMQQVQQALDAGAQVIMLDNMSPEMMSEAVELIAGKALVEASGGITLDNVAQVAATGVDLISIGALTHSVQAADISMLMEPE